MNQFMELWAKEFEKKGIPSSFRQTPSNSVLWFEEYLKSQHMQPGKLLDIGAGKGRNAIHLAKNRFQVSCIDLLQENVSYISEQNIDAKVHDISEKFPFPDSEFDYVIDVFCFKHLTEHAPIQNYLAELKRVIKKGGVYHLSLASIDDSYYGPLLNNSPRPLDRMIVDPVTQIPSILYHQKHIEMLFKGFTLLEFYEKKNMSPMHGKLYARSILSFIFERN
jgi:ubiquinone/menaquinone biosynthesis C-methylase UbiE